MSLQLREYQTTLVQAIRGKWAAGQRRVLAVLPTGGGKTETAINIIEADASPTTRVLVIVERKTLAHQWLARLRRHGQAAGLVQGENTIRVSAPILVCTVQSLRLRGIPDDVALVVVDESHIWHQTHDVVLENLPTVRVLGLTATPLREGLGLRFDTVVVGATIRELIAAGQLVQPRYYSPRAVDVQRALADVAIQAGDYATAPLAAAMRGAAILGDVVSTWQRLAVDRQTIVFAVDKQHARELADQFVAAGITAEVILDDTDDDDRSRLLAEFEALRLRVLVSVGVLSIGFDSPVASCAVMARPTMSLSLYIQQGGRVLRPYPGKADALILDHAANVLTHGKLEAFDPPTDLGLIDKRTDRKTRRDPHSAWVCRECEATNELAEDICTECGAPRYRHTRVLLLDGELVEHKQEHEDDPLPAPTIEQVREFYVQAMWYATSKGMQSPAGWAFHATRRRYRLDETAGRRVIAWAWRDLRAMPPSDEAARWFRADLQRARIAQRYRSGSSRRAA
jgi:DNA repair protein RadD